MVTATNPGAAQQPSPRRHRALLISLLVVVALVAALIAGELYSRHAVKSCMSEQFRDEIGTNVDVGLSPKPMLLQLIDKKVPYITIDSENSQFGPAQGMKVHARVNDVEINRSENSSGTIGSSNADIDWSTDGMLATLKGQSFGGLVSAVKTNGSDGSLQLDVGPAGLAQLTVRPVINASGTVDIQTVNASVLGFGIPTDLVDGVVKTLTDSLQAYPLGLTVKSMKVTDSGIKISLAGGKYTMPASDNTGGKKCGVLT